VRLLAAPATLKEVLPAPEAASALARGARRAGVAADELPLADGGEGTTDVLLGAIGGEYRTTHVEGPFGAPVTALWALLADGSAVVEAAAALGLGLVPASARDPLRASSLGFGRLVAAALAEEPRRLLVGLGGTATVDGGRGLRDAVESLPVPVVALCDVAAPLLGPRGAAHAFGPQKGADAAAVAELEARLAADRELAPFADVPGAGAAGGLGAALAALGAKLVPGARFVGDAVGLRARLDGASLVVTGEGQVDSTTLEGKVPAEVARAAAAAGVPCAVFGGRVLVRPAGVEVHALSGDPARAESDLEDLGERLGASLRRR
jgi:glycerate 2-kinase